MILKNVLQFNFTNGQSLRRNIYKYVTICESNNARNIGKRAKIQGWVRAVRKMKENIFLDVNDGTTNQHLQVIVSKDKKIENLSYGCSITAEGEIFQAPNGRAELKAENLTVIGSCELEGYPFLPRKQYSTDYVRQYLHLRPRTKVFSSTLRLRDLAANIIKDYFRDHDFINIHTPIITSNDCEGAGEIFFVQPNSKQLLKEMKKQDINKEEEIYFNTKTFLTVSGQFHLEVCARSLSRVYNFCPAFRAENNKSRLHLSEFYMIEAEIAFMSSLKELAAEAEFLIKSVTASLFEKGATDLAAIKVPEPSWLGNDFGYITYQQALDILDSNVKKLQYPVKYGEGLAKEHELFLVKHFGNIPVFIVEWPTASKPFYMKQCDDYTKVKALDLLAPTVGELIGGSVREDNYEKLQAKLPVNSNLDWYLDLRKYGNVPTAGFGLGFERYLQMVTGIPNIKDVIPFPRWSHNCSL